MTPEEQYWADMEQMQQDWQRWEEDKLKGPAKIVSITVVYNDPEVKATIAEKGE